MIKIDKKDLNEKMKKYPSAKGIIQREAKRLGEYYDKHPFEDEYRTHYIDDIKDYILFINEDYEKVEAGDRAKFLLSQEKPVYQSLGIGVLNDVLYFGTKVYDGNKGSNAIITNDKKILIDYPEEKQIKQFGLNYRYDFADSILDYQWSNNSSEYSISEFIYGKEKEVSLKECYQDVLNNNEAFMDYPEDMCQVSISCSILSSFFTPLFEAKAREFFNAEKGSGKTKQAILYDLQMFNPLMSADISGASYYRAIESTSCSLIIDDFDAIEDDKKPAQIQIMRTGYKKGQKSIRVGDDKLRTPSAFNIYNSMVINNVGGLDEITQDRCNTYYLIKSNDKKKADKKLNEKSKEWIIQRDKKYYSALQNWKKVQETYENLDVEGVSGRDLERIAPILTIGKLVLEESDYNKLVAFELNRVKDVKTKDVSDDWVFQAIKYVVNEFVRAPEDTRKSGIKIRLDQIVQSIISLSIDDRNYHRTKHAISVYLGKILKNTPLFKAGKVHGGYVCYTFKAEGILKFIEIRDYTDFFTQIELDTLNLSIQSNLPNQSIQHIQSIPIKETKVNGEVG